MSQDALRTRIHEHTAIAVRRAAQHGCPRAELDQIVDWATGPRGSRALVLDGPRRTGKSTLLEHALVALRSRPEVTAAFYVDFTPTEVADAGLTAVLDALGVHAEDGPATVVLLDEPHYSEGWERELKRAVDEQRARLVVADSSSAIAQAAAEAGAGRLRRLAIGPLTFPAWLRLRIAYGVPRPLTAEQRLATCDSWLRRGGMPAPELLLHDEDLLEAHRLLADDITMAAIRGDAARGTNPMPIERLFAWLARDSGTQLDKTKAAEVAGGSRQSIDAWLARLYETGLLWELSPSAASTPKRLRKRPKIYAADTGLVAALTPGGHLPGNGQLLGRLVETACANACREAAVRHGIELGYGLSIDDGRRIRGEADFVFRSGTELLLLEAKSGDGVTSLNGVAQAATAMGAGRATVAARIAKPSARTVLGVSIQIRPLADVLEDLAEHGPEALA